MLTPLRPVLVMPVYRGGQKFERALRSMPGAAPHFRRMVISLNGPMASPDLDAARGFAEASELPLEIIQTGVELPWMAHQYFWLDHLERTGERPEDWLLWFAHDDQLRSRGIGSIVDERGNWPLQHGTIYLGPWGMRYDPPGGLYEGPVDAPLESWTSFPLEGPLRLPVGEWIAQQFEQPTYINMSGCVTQLSSFQALRRFPVRKPGGMRIEMATAAAPRNRFVQEFDEPLVITHTSPVTDRTTYARTARKDDWHMACWMMNYAIRHPGAIPPTAIAASRIARDRALAMARRGQLPAEQWRRRTIVGH